jgi:hypothetical protein
MINYKFWFFILIIFCCLVQGLTIKEPFNYNDCRNKGFSKEFCVQTPISVVGPGQCRCDDGNIGQYIPGFGSQCICIN